MPAPSFSSPASELCSVLFQALTPKLGAGFTPQPPSSVPSAVNSATSQGANTYLFSRLFLFLMRLLFLNLAKNHLGSSPPSAPGYLPGLHKVSR